MIPWHAAGATLSFWLGLVFLLRGVYLLVRKSGAGPAAACLGAGAVGLILSGVLFPTTGLGIPVVWPVLSIQLWIVAAAACSAVFSAFGAILARDRRKGLMALAALAVGAVAFLLPRANPAPPSLLSGHISLTPAVAIGLAALAAAIMCGAAWASRISAARARLGALGRQILLLSGCVVFGIPFLFLLVTSFKEDRDMSSPNGIVWIPRVVQTRPVMNPDRPYYEGRYKGLTVQADLERQADDGTLTLRIAHPQFYAGYTFDAKKTQVKEIPRDMPIVKATHAGGPIEGVVYQEDVDGSQIVEVYSPAALKGQHLKFGPKQTEQMRPVSLRWKNYVEALEYLPPEAAYGWTYVRNTLILVVMNVLGALVSCSVVAYGFSRLTFPGREFLFKLMLSTMMLPAAVTLMPQFLIFRSLGWVNTLQPLWVPSWFGSAFSVFMLRQFFQQVPFELEDAAKIDGCSYLRSLWSVMLPQVKPALVVIAIMTFLGAWNNFMGPLVYSSSPETLPISYAVQLFNGERNGEPGLLLAFVTMSLVPVIALFAFAQRFFIEGASLSGFGGR